MMIVINFCFVNDISVICYFYQSNYNFQLAVLLSVNIAQIIFPSNRCYGNTWDGSRASQPNNHLKTSHFPKFQR